MNYLLFTLLAINNFVFAMSPPQKIVSLPKLKIQTERITTSGISSGAFFAVQFHIAFSDMVSGSGSVAGGAFGCSEGSQLGAQKCMGSPERVSAQSLWNETVRLSQTGQIDSVENLKNDRVYIFSSQFDFIVRPNSANVLREYFQNSIASENILKVDHPRAAHGFLTEDFGRPCGVMGKPWIQDCDYNMANEILDHLDPIQKVGISSSGETIYFNQTEFFEGDIAYPWGAIYIPNQCREKKCGLHIAFHGCQMTPDDIQTDFILKSGFQKAADKHGVVVLFPQSKNNSKNSGGCWDWFGIYDSQYLTKEGQQMKAVKKMVDRLLGIKE